MIEEALEQLRMLDSFAAIVYLNQHPDSAAVAQAYADLVRRLYWQEKDLDAAVAMARAGIQQALTAALALLDSEPDRAAELRAKAKALAYDLASFTWPGWDEPGIEIDAAHCAIGLDAARANLRLAIELQKGDLPLSRAHWILGAHHLAAADREAARASFEKAAAHARTAGSPAEELLSLGFARLAEALASLDASDATGALASIKARLAEVENGAAFVEQLETAGRVLSRQQVEGSSATKE